MVLLQSRERLSGSMTVFIGIAHSFAAPADCIPDFALDRLERSAQRSTRVGALQADHVTESKTSVSLLRPNTRTDLGSALVNCSETGMAASPCIPRVVRPSLAVLRRNFGTHAPACGSLRHWSFFGSNKCGAFKEELGYRLFLPLQSRRTFGSSTLQYTMSDDKPITAYPNAAPQKQEQNLPGTDKSMEPLAGEHVFNTRSQSMSNTWSRVLNGCGLSHASSSEHTKLERWDRDGKPYLQEYVGSGKLADKSVIITGSDSGIGKSVASELARSCKW